MSNRNNESQVSLPDQLPIAKTESTASVEEVYKLDKPKVLLKKRFSKQYLRNIKPKTPLTKKYFTAGKGVTAATKREVEKEPSPFSYPSDLEEFAHKVMTKAWRDNARIKESNLKCYQKPSYRTRVKKDILDRLYMEEKGVDKMKTVMDIDPQYFSIIEGRSIPSRLNIRDYIQTIKDCLKTRIIIGFRSDDIMLIEENLYLEQRMIDIIKEKYQTYVNAFEEFLYQDHTSAMELLREAESASIQAYDKYEEYKVVSKKYGALRSSLYNSEEKWRNCKTYQKFLYTISPITWRLTHIKSLGKEILGQLNVASKTVHKSDDEDDDIFGGNQSPEQQEVSLTDILKQFKDECKNDGPPDLYFTDPEEVGEIFRFMEVQNMNSLLHGEELAIPLDLVAEGMLFATEMYDKEIKSLQEIIDKLEGGIRWEEERAKYLEELGSQLINDEFKTLSMNDDVLNLHVFVEDVYETRIGPNDANLSVSEMMRSIEEKYRNELLQLDKVPSDQVAVLEGSCYMEQMMVMRLAERAARQYTELEMLTNSLNKAFSPPYQKPPVKEPKNRSPPIKPPTKVEPPPRELTFEEVEFLEYFTDFCKHLDDPIAYGIDTSKVLKLPSVELLVDGKRAQIFGPDGKGKHMDKPKVAIIEKAIRYHS